MEHGTTRFGSVDWASQGHAACIVDDHGTALEEFEVAHSDAGLTALCRRFAGAGVGRVAIERPDGPVVDALLGAGLEVVVVSSRAVKALRTRYGLAGNKDDRSDAFVLADCLRTGGHRWPSLQPDSPQTLALRAAVRTRKDLVTSRVATANPLRAHLQLVFPGAVGLFADIDSTISLDFLERFSTTAKASGFIFQSLPRSGCVRAAALLVEIGDCRARFPTADSLAALAGAVPSTRSSGKHHVVTFRWACDKKLRDAVLDFAQDTPRANLWADRLYRKHRSAGKTHPHAARILARAWIYVIWRCWSDRVAYEPAKHRALESLRSAA